MHMPFDAQPSSIIGSADAPPARMRRASDAKPIQDAEPILAAIKSGDAESAAHVARKHQD